MCQKVRAEYMCSDMHEDKDEEWTRVTHFARCNIAIANGVICPPASAFDGALFMRSRRVDLLTSCVSAAYAIEIAPWLCFHVS